MDINEAAVIARKWHGAQKDKTGDDYVTGHLTRVAITLSEEGHSEDIVIAGMLHDVLEDTPCTSEQLIEAGISQKSISLIQTVTRKADESYDDFIDRIIATSNIAIDLKLADMSDNLTEARLERLPPNVAQKLRDKYAEPYKKLLEAWNCIDPDETP